MNSNSLSSRRGFRAASAAAAAGVALCGVVGMATLSGCGSTGTHSASSVVGATTGRAKLTITWPARTSSKLIPIASNSIVASFYLGTTLEATQTIARPTTGNTSTVTFGSLPPGTLTLVATAYPNTGGTGTAQATATNGSVVITAGQDTATSITMASTIAALTVTPASPSIASGATTTLAATATDASGATVLTSTSITWASSNTAVATVGTSTGVVTAGSTAGTAVITATDSESGKTASTTVTVASSTTGACSSQTGSAQVACYALDFYNNQGLTTAQKTKVQLAFTSTTATKWSNLPVGSNRNGISIGDDSLTTAQETAFLAIVKSALNSTDAAGYTTYTMIREADDYLTNYQGSSSGGGQGGAYGSDKYYMAFLGTPSTSGIWELQLTGHHSVFNIVFNGPTVIPTPNFVGVEPNDVNQTPVPVSIPIGETTKTAAITPIAARRNDMQAIFTSLQSIDATKFASAKLSSSFTDVMYGPSTDAAFVANTTKQGVAISSLSTSDQTTIIPLVKTAINDWVNTLPEAQAAVVRSLYESDTAIQSTYIGYALPSGQTAPTPTAQGVYYRIDGPNVWIEFVCQNGVVISSQIHYHTIWRDHKLDYGGELSGLHQ